MLLTLFFMAVSWIQSWRFNVVKSTIRSVLNQKSSISMYKDCHSSIPTCKVKGNGGGNYIPCRSLSSSVCFNQNEASLSNLLMFSASKRVCSILPQQQVDVNNWIAVSSEKTDFPLKLSGNTQLKLDESHVFIIVESDLDSIQQVQNSLSFDVEYFGIPKGWYVGDLFVLLLESDITHLTELTSLFLSNNLCFSNKMEITRIESVEVKGEPCKLSGVDLSSIVRKLKSGSRGVINIKDEKDGLTPSHKKLYSSICEAAANAVNRQSSITVPELGLTINPENIQESFCDSHVLNCDEEDRAKSCDFDWKDSNDSLSPRSPCDSVINHSNSSNYLSEFDTFRSTPLSQPNKRHLRNLVEFGTDKSNFTSTDSLNTAYSTVSRRSVSVSHHGEASTGKPPLVTIFSSSSSSMENIRNSLCEILERDRYTIHCLSLNKLDSPWIQKSKLVVICGNVPPSYVSYLLKYLVSDGGQILCICSDLLVVFLSSFQTAEVRPEVVRLNYDKWKHVPLMHHVFCYQPSPSSDQFPVEESLSDSVMARTPSSVEVVDMNNESHTLLVKVLAVEETWQTPSLLLSTCLSSDGKVLFSQVHLEVDSVKSELSSEKSNPDNKARLEILADILSKHFDIKCRLGGTKHSYTPAYFLGKHEQKSEFLEQLKDVMSEDHSLKIKDITIKFYGKGQNPSKASENFLPVLLHSCPARFSTVEYFDNLKSKRFGRLLIYSDVLKTSMALLAGPKMKHGLAVIPRLQTQGSGRAGNEWLSPDGSASYSIQVHLALNTNLGRYVSLVQHIASLASISAILSKPGYEALSLSLKWPNDIYAGDNVKIGGVAVASSIYNTTAVCNIGCGLNLSNSLPTTCINDMIEELNTKSGTKLSKISHELYFAWVFTELERLFDLVQEGRIEDVLDLYYQYWLHDNAEVYVVQADGSKRKVTIVGLDAHGFLEVKGENGEKFSVQPDGNSFDMLEGLIVPK